MMQIIIFEVVFYLSCVLIGVMLGLILQRVTENFYLRRSAAIKFNAYWIDR